MEKSKKKNTSHFVVIFRTELNPTIVDPMFLIIRIRYFRRFYSPEKKKLFISLY